MGKGRQTDSQHAFYPISSANVLKSLTNACWADAVILYEAKTTGSPTPGQLEWQYTKPESFLHLQQEYFLLSSPNNSTTGKEDNKMAEMPEGHNNIII